MECYPYNNWGNRESELKIKVKDTYTVWEMFLEDFLSTKTNSVCGKCYLP